MTPEQQIREAWGRLPLKQLPEAADHQFVTAVRCEPYTVSVTQAGPMCEFVVSVWNADGWLVRTPSHFATADLAMAKCMQMCARLSEKRRDC